MLPVRVDAPAERIAVLVRVPVARRDAGAQSSVLAERNHLGAAVASDLRRPVGRTVVDDDDVGFRKALPQLREHPRQVVLLVPGRNEDDRVVALGAHAGVSLRSLPPRISPPCAGRVAALTLTGRPYQTTADGNDLPGHVRRYRSQRVVDARIERVGGVQRDCLGAREAPSLGRSVMRGDDAQERLERALVDARPRAGPLDPGQPEVHVAEQGAALARQDHGTRDEGVHAAAVVQQRRGQEQVGVEARVQLRRLAAERGNGNRVLREPAGVGVMAVLGRRGRAEPLAVARLAEYRRAEGAQAVVVDLADEEVDVAVEVLDVAPGPGHELGRVAGLDALHVAHLELDLAGVLAHAAEHADGVAYLEPLLEHGDAVPHASADAPALVGELEVEEWASVAARAPLLARHREGRTHGGPRRELAHERATGHSGEYRPTLAASSDAELEAR